MFLHQSCKSVSLLDSSSPFPLYNYAVAQFTIKSKFLLSNSNCSVSKPINVSSFFNSGSSKTLVFSQNFPILRGSHVACCSQKDVLDSFSSNPLPEKLEFDGIRENGELELLNKPSPVIVSNGSDLDEDVESKKLDKDEALAPFLKFFKGKDSLEGVNEEGEAGVVEDEVVMEVKEVKEENSKKVSVAYYEPKPGDFVVGVVVSGNENKLDVHVGADMLGTMLTKEVLPLYDKEMEYLLCDLDKDVEEFMVRGKMGICKDDDARRRGPVQGRPVVDTGTVLFSEVLGRTLSGRPLLSTRRFFRRIAWHRARQIKQLNEPIEVKIIEWNTGGLLTRIEGLRAFLPKAELLNRVNSFTELKENVGRKIQVKITRMDEDKNDLILSEKVAWEMLHLREGTLLEGTVRKIYPYGAQIRIGETNRSGLLHISNISRSRITSVSDLLTVDEKVKVLVVKPMFPNKISLSIADLESEAGLFISNKEKVFSEAEAMAKKYRQKLPANLAARKLESLNDNALPFDDEARLYANWKWFKFDRGDQSS